MLAGPTFSIPKGEANPSRKVWDKLIQWDEFIANENRVDRCGQTQSSEGQLGRSYEANAEIQSGGNLIRIDRPGDIDRIFINILVGFSKIAFQDDNALGKVKRGKAKRE